MYWPVEATMGRVSGAAPVAQGTGATLPCLQPAPAHMSACLSYVAHLY